MPFGQVEYKSRSFTSVPRWVRAASGLSVAIAISFAVLLPGIAVREVQAQASAESTANQQFLLAYRLFNRGEDRLAAEAFDEFIGGFPNDAKRGDALYYRAMLARRMGNNRAAARFLTDAPAPSLVPAYAPLVLRGQVYTDLAMYDEALEALEQVPVASLDDVPAASVKFLQGTAYRGAGNLSGALQAMEDAATHDSPLKARAMLEQGHLLALQDKPAEAIAMLKACLAQGDRSVTPDAARLAGDLSYQLRQYPEAVGFYDTVVRNHQSSPHFAPAAVGVLWAQLGAQQYNAVQRAADQLRPALRGHDAFLADYISASAFQADNRHAEAAAKFREVLAHPPSASQPRDRVVYKLAISLFELREHAQLSRTLATFQQQFPDSPLVGDAEFLLAASELAQGNRSAAAARLTAIINDGPDNPHYREAVLQRARLYESTEQHEAAVSDYRRYVDQTITEGGTLARGKPSEAMLRLADLLNRLGKPKESLAVTNQLLDVPPTDPLVEQEAMYRRARSLIDDDRLPDAIAALEALSEKHPQNRFAAESSYYRGLLMLTLGRVDEAVDPLIAAARSDLPAPLRVRSYRLAAAQLHPSRPAFAVELLYELERLAGREVLTPGELIWIGRHLTQTGDARRALAYMDSMLDPDSPAPGVARAEAVLLAGLNMQALERRSDAIMFFRQVRAISQGFELEAQLQLARTLWRMGQLEEAIEEYRGLISVDRSDIAAPAVFDSAQIHRQLAQKHVDNNDPAAAEQSNNDALRLYKRLTVLWARADLSPIPELSFINLAELEAQLNEGNPQATYAELIERFPDGPYAIYAEASIARIQRQEGEALFTLRKLQEESSLDPRLSQRVTRAIRLLEDRR